MADKAFLFLLFLPALLFIAALIINKKWVSVLSIIVIQLFLWLLVLQAFVYRERGCPVNQENAEPLQDALRAAQEFREIQDVVSLIFLLGSTAIVILCIRGFRK